MMATAALGASERTGEFRPAPLQGRTLDAAIVQTVVYSSLFDYPLTLAELRDTLIGTACDEGQILARYRSSSRLQSVIAYDGGHFFPRGRGALVDDRRRREDESRQLLERYRRTLKLIASIPFTRLVALSGSIAHLNVEGRGDIDLFVVTRARRVWFVTVTAILLSKLMGSRRALCLNFVVSERQLAARQRDLFTANQIIHLRPLIGGDVLVELVDRNEFLFDFYPNFFPPTGAPPALSPGRFARALKKLAECALAPGLGLGLDLVCRQAYRRYLQAQSSTWQSPDQVVLEPEYLKLHTRSHRASVLERFEREGARMLEHATSTWPG